jgi:hypothetical protein
MQARETLKTKFRMRKKPVRLAYQTIFEVRCKPYTNCTSSKTQPGRLGYAYAVALLSRMTVTLIWPGYSNSC